MSIRFSFNKQDKIKFHQIFFETNKLLFYGKIELYKQFLKGYEPEWLNQNPDFFEKLEEIKKIRNDFAHGMNPSEDDLKIDDKLPAVLLYTYKKGRLETIEYTVEEISEIGKKMDRIIELLKIVYSKVINQRNNTRKIIFEQIRSLLEPSSQDKNQ